MSSIVWVFMTSSAPLSWVASKQHPSDGWNQKIPTPTTNVWEDCIYHTTAFYFECSPLFYPKQHTSSSRCYRWNFASHASTGFSQHTLHTRACKPTYTQPKPVFRYTKASSSLNFIMFVKLKKTEQLNLTLRSVPTAATQWGTKTTETYCIVFVPHSTPTLACYTLQEEESLSLSLFSCLVYI